MASTVLPQEHFPKSDLTDASANPRERLELQQRLIRDFILMDVRHAEILLADIQKYLQQHPDLRLSLFYEYHKGFVENQIYNYRLAEKHYQRALSLAEELDDKIWQVQCKVEYAALKVNEQQVEYAVKLLEDCHQLLDTYPNSGLRARVCIRQGFVHLHYASYDSAIKAFLEAERLLDQESDGLPKYFFQAYLFSGLGIVYDKVGKSKMFLKYCQKANALCEKYPIHSTRRAWYYLSLGNAFKANDQFDEAAKYYQAVNNIDDDYSILARAGATANLGALAFKKWDFALAKQLYDRAYDLYRQKNPEDYRNFAQIEMWLADLAQFEDRVEDEEQHLEKAYLFSIEESFNYGQSAQLSAHWAAFYKRQKRYKEAYELLEVSKNWERRFHQHISENRIQDLELQHELEKNRKEAQLYRLQVETLQQRALRAQMNPHFLFNALNSIQSFTLQGNKKQASKYLEKFSKLMRRSLYNSELDFISLEEEIEFLRQYLDLNANLRFGGKLQYEIHIGPEVEDDILDVPTMIVQPYVENAIEHGLRPKESGKVDITYQMQGEALICIVQDNGIGLRAAAKLQKPDLENHKSRGTAITEKRLQILHKNFDRSFVETIELIDPNSEVVLGTRVTLEIPIQVAS